MDLFALPEPRGMHCEAWRMWQDGCCALQTVRDACRLIGKQGWQRSVYRRSGPLTGFL